MPPAPDHQPWDQPPAAQPEPARRAALLLWLLGAVDLVVFGCCSVAFSIAASGPQSQLQVAAPRLPPEMIAQVYPLLWPMAILVFVLGFLPGVAYLLTGFGVRAGRRPPTMIALLLVTTQTIVWGVLFLTSVFQSLRAGSPTDLTVQFLTLGSYLTLLGFTLVWLLRARQAGRGDQQESSEPWNDPTP